MRRLSVYQSAGSLRFWSWCVSGHGQPRLVRPPRQGASGSFYAQRKTLLSSRTHSTLSSFASHTTLLLPHSPFDIQSSLFLLPYKSLASYILHQPYQKWTRWRVRRPPLSDRRARELLRKGKRISQLWATTPLLTNDCSATPPQKQIFS